MVGDKRTNTDIQLVQSGFPPPAIFWSAANLWHDSSRRQTAEAAAAEVHLPPPFPQGKKDILHDVFRRLAVMDHLKSPCTQGFIVIAE